MAATEETPTVDRRRILALDGGGVRGAFAIEILAKMQELLRQHYNNPKLRLCDHFKFIAGTSTGAIIATLLSWGVEVEKVRDLYRDRCDEIFPPIATWRVWKLGRLIRALYESDKLSDSLIELFYDDQTGKTALLGTKKLNTTLLVCMRNATTGSAWPITNNPLGKYNEPGRADCNLNIPLWQLVRASTAAPVYFLPQRIAMGRHKFDFVDGGVTAYNNPAMISYLMATLPCYHLDWPSGADKLLVVSIGTGRIRSVLKDSSLMATNIGANLMNIPSGLMENISLQQDFLCRVMGRCIFGDNIDREVGNLLAEAAEASVGDKQFTYVRYDHKFEDEELEAINKDYGRMDLSNIKMIPFLMKLGEAYAEKNIKIEHLL